MFGSDMAVEEEEEELVVDEELNEKG